MSGRYVPAEALAEPNDRGAVWTRETAIHYIDVIPMIANFRVATTRKTSPPMPFFERFWCYEGRGQASFVAAVLAASAWDGSDETEPAGWSKNGQTGEWREKR